MELPKALIIIGFSIVLLGVVTWGAQKIPWTYGWFGHLPGDIRIERENSSFYAPIASMMVLSLLFSLLVSVLQRFLGR